MLKVQLTLPLLQTTYQIRNRYLGEIYHEVYDTNNVAQYICKLYGQHLAFLFFFRYVTTWPNKTLVLASCPAGIMSLYVNYSA